MQPLHASASRDSSIDAFLPDAVTLAQLKRDDAVLLNELYQRNQSIPTRSLHALDQELRKTLTQKGTFHIPIIRQHSVMIDGQIQHLALVAATDMATHHGEMSSMLYLRDHIQAARVYAELFLRDSSTYTVEGQVGRDLLLSALHLLSTPAQLDRFRIVIQKGASASQEEWPHISLWFDDLEGKKSNGWRNKQDTFQMLAHLTFDMLDRGFISIDELLPSHKTFLGMIVPFLKSVGFPRYENSGSWEEITAVRTSVMAIETALLHKIKTVTSTSEYAFLKMGDESFDATVTSLLHEGLAELGQRLPNESPEYPKDSIKYREADASMTYVLLYGLPHLLVASHIPVNGKNLSEEEIETLILNSLHTLDDPLTGGMLRYRGDSYQRVNFHTNTVQTTIGAIKAFVKDQADHAHTPIDLEMKQSLRNTLTPSGREAAWTHPLGQLAAWAARKHLDASLSKKQQQHYQALCHTYIRRILQTVTPEGYWHMTLNNEGRYQLQEVPAWRLPECLITYQLPDKAPLIVPSPHTPLNWSSVSLKEAIGLDVLAR